MSFLVWSLTRLSTRIYRQAASAEQRPGMRPARPTEAHSPGWFCFRSARQDVGARVICVL